MDRSESADVSILRLLTPESVSLLLELRRLLLVLRLLLRFAFSSHSQNSL